MDTFAHKLTGITRYDYRLRLVANNKMEIYSELSFSFNLDIVDDKLRFTNVSSIAWDNIWVAAQKYLDYEDGTMTLLALPGSFSK